MLRLLPPVSKPQAKWENLGTPRPERRRRTLLAAAIMLLLIAGSTAAIVFVTLHAANTKVCAPPSPIH